MSNTDPSSSTPTASSDAPFHFGAGTLVNGELRVASFTGTETVSRAFAFDIVVLARNQDEIALQNTLVGQPAWLRFDNTAGVRIIQGVVARLATAGTLSRGDQSFKVRLVPRLWLLKKRINTRIFQDMSMIEIVSLVFSEQGIAYNIDQLQQTYATRSYCVQYQESDFDFVRRLLAEEGVWFYFQQPDPNAATVGDATLMLTDAPASVPILGDPTLVFRQESPGQVPHEEHVFELSLGRSLRSTAARLHDYDFQRPLFDLSGRGAVKQTDTSADPNAAVDPSAGAPATDGNAELSVFEHHGRYEELATDDDRAKVVVDALRRRAVLAHGRSPCRRLAPGFQFTMTEHEAAGLNQDYVITKVHHEGRDTAGTGDKLAYVATFSCVPTAVPLRPRRPHRAHRQVMETATVTGPIGQEIYTDMFGRVRVQFHWDDAADPEQSSCWMRVAQAWAGTSWGFQFIPRVGMEVLVSFLGGDIDRPVVVGALYNATHPPPVALPGSASKSGIRTQSTPGGDGFNELMFDDTAGAEQIGIKAQKDLHADIGNGATIAIGGNRGVTVAGNDSLMVQGDQQRYVAGVSREEVIGDDFRSVLGNATAEYLGNRSAEISHNESTTVDGSSITDVRGDVALSVAGNYTVSVGTGDLGETAFQVSGSHVMGASVALRLLATQSITFTVGDSSVTIDDKGIKLEGATIQLKGSKSVSAEGPGPAMKLGDEAEISAKTVTVRSEQAKMVLDKDAATIKAPAIAMATNTPKTDTASPEAPPNTQKLGIVFTDQYGEAYANKTYQLSVEGKIIEGKTDEDGALSQDVPKEAVAAQVKLWIDKYPEGRTRVYAVDINPTFPDLSTNKGAKMRLKNLGYFFGELDDTDDGLDAALLRFQSDYDIDPTGKLDGPTIAGLQKAHGH